MDKGGWIQKWLTPRNKKGFTKIAFRIFDEFQLIIEGVASDSAVYTYLEHETRVNNTFVPHSLFMALRQVVLVSSN
ncbi:hypothetical protein E1H99_12795 [Enterococcus hirae]|nr:hypothetical protein E1H99_12795 [Enterococcus hirae]